MSITKAIILAAGEGRRMRPLTYSRPKVMLPLAGKPILEHLLLQMKRAGVGEFIFVVGYRGNKIKNYFNDGVKLGVKIQYLTQSEQLGTADAIRTARSLISESVLVANGDAIVDYQDISNLIHREGNVLTVIELPDLSGLGAIEILGENVVNIQEKMEKPTSRFANAGLYLLTPEIFEAIERTEISQRGEYEITDSIKQMINSGTQVSYIKIKHWINLSYPWDMLRANEEIMSDLEPQFLGEIEQNVVLKGAVSIGKGAIVRSGSYIVGPVVIGQKCEIGPNCYILSSTAIADNCHVGAGVEVKNSIIMAGSKLPHMNYVSDSVIGENCYLGAGTKAASLRLNNKTVIINNIDTGRYELGSILGDKVETGVNASINAGTLIGDKTIIGPGVLAHGVISPHSKIL